MADKPPQKIHDEIPVERAWQDGRRIYIKCSKNSQLGQKLFEMQATWDGDVGARYVGTQRKNLVIPLILEHLARIAAVDEVRAAGRWVALPRGEGREAIYQWIKGLGNAVYDGERKEWAMPSDDAYTEVKEMIAEVGRQQAAAREQQRQAQAVQRAAEDTAMAEQQLTRKQVREQQLIAASGRTVTDHRGEGTARIYGYMKRAEAERHIYKPGHIERVGFGAKARRLLVLESSAEFWSQDDIDDSLVSGGTGSEPGWRCAFTYIVVEPTPQEAAFDAAEQAHSDDQKEIAAVLDVAWRGGTMAEVTSFTQVTGPTIVEGWLHSGDRGKITVAADGGVWYQHPGSYDDYRRTEGQITDPGLLERIHAIVAGGPRRYHVYPSGLQRQYTVTVPSPEDGPGIPEGAIEL